MRETKRERKGEKSSWKQHTRNLPVDSKLSQCFSPPSKTQFKVWQANRLLDCGSLWESKGRSSGLLCRCYIYEPCATTVEEAKSGDKPRSTLPCPCPALQPSQVKAWHVIENFDFDSACQPHWECCTAAWQQGCQAACKQRTQTQNTLRLCEKTCQILEFCGRVRVRVCVWESMSWLVFNKNASVLWQIPVENMKTNKTIYHLLGEKWGKSFSLQRA